MNCRNIQAKFPDYLTGDLEPETVESVRRHVTTCASCREELESITTTWTQLGVLEEAQPGPNLRKNFYAMLESYREGLQQEKQGFPIFESLKKFFAWPARPAYQLAFTMLLLIVGFLGGYMITSSPASQAPEEMAELRGQVHQMRQQLAVSLLSQSSPSQRLKGVAWTSTVENPDEKTLDTLLYTLNNDPNVNVRLSAVDALYLFSSDPMVKKGLIDSLANQASPLVQVALIDLMVEMREKRAADALKQLIQRNKLNSSVKKRAQLVVDQLI
jgi:hypothetical protein